MTLEYYETYIGDSVEYRTLEYKLYPKEEYWITFQLDLKDYDPNMFIFQYQVVHEFIKSRKSELSKKPDLLKEILILKYDIESLEKDEDCEIFDLLYNIK